MDTNVVLPQPLPKKQLLGYNSFESRLALLPMTLVIMSSIISFTPKLRNRFGIKRNLVIGLGLLAIGIVWCLAGQHLLTAVVVVVVVMKAGLLSICSWSVFFLRPNCGFGYVVSIYARIKSSIKCSKRTDGRASGCINTSYQIGFELGLAIIVILASSQTET